MDSRLYAHPEGPRNTLRPDVEGDLYFMFHAATGLDSIDHLWLQKGTLPQERLYLEARRGDSVYRVEKTDQIAQGSYGVLYVRRRCYFRPAYRNSVSAGFTFKDRNREWEHPEPLAGPPAPLPAITSISLVRIYQNVPPDLASSIAQSFGISQLPPAEKPDGFSIAADYEVDGTLTGSAFSISRGGNWERGVEGGRFSVSGEFDLPLRFDVQAYERTGKLPKAIPGLTPNRSLVLVIYGFGKLIRHDEIAANQRAATQWLRPVSTEEQTRIDPPCEAQLRKQQAEGQSTTW